MRRLLEFIFPGLEQSRLNREFVKDFSDSEPFLKDCLRDIPLATEMNGPSQIRRYELWKFIKEIAPKE